MKLKKSKETQQLGQIAFAGWLVDTESPEGNPVLKETESCPKYVQEYEANSEMDVLSFLTGKIFQVNNWNDHRIELEVIPQSQEHIGDFPVFRIEKVLLDNSVPGKFSEVQSEIASEDEMGQESAKESFDAKNQSTFEYQLLSRLRTDCEYFLGAGNQCQKHLWAGNIKAQIAKMRELYAKLPQKPEWLSVNMIDNYEWQMLSAATISQKKEISSPVEQEESITMTEAEKTFEKVLDEHPVSISIPVNGQWKTFSSVKAVEEAAFEEYKDSLCRNAQNFRITDVTLDKNSEGGPKAKFRWNVNAIKLLKYLEECSCVIK